MPEPEIINQAALARLLDSLGGDADFLNELADAYLASTPDLFAKMRQAIAAGDAPGLQRAAHSLKSGSANFGALSFAGLCKELEEMGKMAALEGAAEKLAAIELAYTQVVTALLSEVEGARSTAA